MKNRIVKKILRIILLTIVGARYSTFYSYGRRRNR